MPYEILRMPLYQATGAKALPFRYHYGMSKQIAVRLPDDLVDFVDEIVDSGTERSRAAVVTRHSSASVVASLPNAMPGSSPAPGRTQSS